jgi:hypothetical protein
MYLSYTGSKETTIAVINTGDLEAEEQQGTFHFKESIIQAPEITEVCWLLVSSLPEKIIKSRAVFATSLMKSRSVLKYVEILQISVVMLRKPVVM